MPQGIFADEADQIYCSKCRKTMASVNFYTYKDGSKSELCKSCLTMHINNFEPDTFLWLLEKFDVPYIPAEWNILRDRAYQKDPYKMNGMSVFGKYLSKMKLKQWKAYTWADTEKLQTEAEEKAKLYGQPDELVAQRMAEMEEAYHNGTITEAQWMTYKEINAPTAETLVQSTVTSPDPAAYPVNNYEFERVELPDVGNDLTDEDKIYLAMKWGRLYSAADWVSLEQQYKKFEESFDLHNADLISGTKQLCKLDLKCNQALDSGDIDSYSKLARASDSLRKSLKFTEAQRQDEKSASLSCYGQIVAYCEKTTGFIPKIDLTVDRDIADADLRDIKEYNLQLIKDDPAVYKQLENYIKKREQLAEMEADDISELSDEDFAEFNRSIENQKATDEEVEENESTIPT